ncbi:unnamed protein product [Penicillium roqueforti FM164]|uniref:Genomic scaffold, ProqFM164S02 n=1 Tax=Penicillium roqueforti (strain FM164) TaxID=1365484 RepID=W6Q8L7_PENRF|nr:unnamed protein product [Penicillium roqueforti FM164]
MDTLDYRNLCNCAIGIIIGTLRFSYFIIYLLIGLQRLVYMKRHVILSIVRFIPGLLSR